jgi:valyl-tRNA synthetase
VDFVAVEHEILDFWEQHQTFKKLIAQNANGPKWAFQDGPITANNPMGVHHAWGRTYKDIFHRYKAMNGFRTRYQTVSTARDYGSRSKLKRNSASIQDRHRKLWNRKIRRAL